MSEKTITFEIDFGYRKAIFIFAQFVDICQLM